MKTFVSVCLDFSKALPLKLTETDYAKIADIGCHFFYNDGQLYYQTAKGVLFVVKVMYGA